MLSVENICSKSWLFAEASEKFASFSGIQYCLSYSYSFCFILFYFIYLFTYSFYYSTYILILLISTYLTRKPQVQFLLTWISLESLSYTFLKNVPAKAMFSRYCCLKVGRNYDLHNGLQGAKWSKTFFFLTIFRFLS